MLLGATLFLFFYSEVGDLTYALAAAVILTTVLIRFGLLACAFCWFVSRAELQEMPTDWTAWHSQPAVAILVLFVLLAGYGFWAATAGRPLLAERDG